MARHVRRQRHGRRRDTGPHRAGGDVFDVALLPRPGGRLLRGLRLAGAVVAQLSLQLVPSPSVHDVVVTRRADGTEVVREPAGDPLVAGDMLAGVRRDLDTLDAETFLAGWTARSER